MKNIIAAVLSFVVLSTMLYLGTYWFDSVSGEGRKLIITFWCIIIAFGSYVLPVYFIIEKPFK